MRAKVHSEINTVGVIIREKRIQEQVRDVIYSQLFEYEVKRKKKFIA
jgi:hypothetical protein